MDGHCINTACPWLKCPEHHGTSPDFTDRGAREEGGLLHPSILLAHRYHIDGLWYLRNQQELSIKIDLCVHANP